MRSLPPLGSASAQPRAAAAPLRAAARICLRGERESIFSSLLSSRWKMPSHLPHPLETDFVMHSENGGANIALPFVVRVSLRVIYIISAIMIQPITQINRLCIDPNARIVLLQIFPVKSSRKFFSFKCLQNVCITRNTSVYSEWPFPCWRPFAEF